MEFDHVCDLIERFNLVSYVSAELQPNDRAISVTVTDPRDAR